MTTDTRRVLEKIVEAANGVGEPRILEIRSIYEDNVVEALTEIVRLANAALLESKEGA